MGNEPLCARDTRDFRNSTYIMCGKQPEFRHSTSINIVNQVPVVSGPPLNFQKQQTFKKVEKSASEFCMKNGLDNMYIPLVSRIIAYGHNNIFMAYRRLPEHNKQQFLQEIKYADVDFLDLLYHKYILGERQSKKVIMPPSKIADKAKMSQSQLNRYIETGLKLLGNGEVGFVFLCGGSSSRFMFQQKFLYPFDQKQGRTIIEVMLDRLRRNLGAKQNSNSKVSPPIILACNEYNRNIIQNYLKSKNYCGFDPSRIRYLTTPSLPVLNSKGKICLTFQHKILSRPSGTLKCIEQLLGSGLSNWLKSLKINNIHIVGCENLMQNPGDPFLLGYLKEQKLQIVGKCTEPIFPAEQFQRYSGANDGKTYLTNPEDILNYKADQKTMESLMEKCPIAMNSIVCGLQQLKNMTKQYQNSMFLSLEYTAYKKNENYYDFQKNKPIVSSPVYVFQKQIGHLLTCSNKHALMKVPRSQYLPILSKNSSYSLAEGCKKMNELL